MFDSTIYGVACSLGWGSADFIARFTSRALGLLSALLGMLFISAVILSGVVWYMGIPIVYDASGWKMLLLAGVSFMLATLLLYWGLSRGPVTVVAPIAGAFPAFNLIFAIATGVRPGITQWIAMVMVMLGVGVVAAFAKETAVPDTSEQTSLRATICIALAASVGLATTVAAGQAAMTIYGEVQTVWIMRWIAVFTLGAVFVGRREAPTLPLSWWPVLGVQGVLDGAAYLFLLLGGHGIGGQITVVIGSTFSAVTVILGRIFLRETMTVYQWFGVFMIVAGVALLST